MNTCAISLHSDSYVEKQVKVYAMLNGAKLNVVFVIMLMHSFMGLVKCGGNNPVFSFEFHWTISGYGGDLSPPAVELCERTASSLCGIPMGGFE